VLQERRRNKKQTKENLLFSKLSGLFFELLPLSIPNSYTMLTRAFP